MSRIHTADTIESSPPGAHPLLEAVQRKLGRVPNMFRLIAASPAALEGYVGLDEALAKGGIDARTRERIALAVAEVNQCDYCLSAHAYLGQNLAKLTREEIEANRDGTSGDRKAAAAVRLAAQVAAQRGGVTSADIQAARDAGYQDAQLVEIVALVALNTLTNYMNRVAETELDFPALAHRS